jgi:hypothetical protein
MNVYWCNGTMTLTGEKLMYSEKKFIAMPLCPTKTPHGLARNQNWASAVTGWQIAT